MERKGMQVELKDAAKGLVEAVFSTFNVRDHDGDVTLPGAFTDGAKVRISAYGHRSWWGDLPVGKGVIEVTETDARLMGEFFMDTEVGRETFGVVKAMGELQEWSYAFDVVASEMGQQDGQDVRFLKQLDVHEVSPVLKGAGIGTQTVAVKGADGAQLLLHITSTEPAAAKSVSPPGPPPDYRDVGYRELARLERTRFDLLRTGRW